ncbi:hypothetical protein GW7_21408 [Heterocephalus glaber]|uniref:Uncharacterized protein n=1 Tax=Heterocephalus glaber TaxID=10181 RepID=G5BTU1_HETGA|nr:hypothetical protein GW7_21408 [Heterocephalus glaber]
MAAHRVGCGRVQRVSLHSGDPKDPFEGLEPTVVSHGSPYQGVKGLRWKAAASVLQAEESAARSQEMTSEVKVKPGAPQKKQERAFLRFPLIPFWRQSSLGWGLHTQPCAEQPKFTLQRQLLPYPFTPHFANKPCHRFELALFIALFKNVAPLPPKPHPSLHQATGLWGHPNLTQLIRARSVRREKVDCTSLLRVFQAQFKDQQHPETLRGHYGFQVPEIPQIHLNGNGMLLAHGTESALDKLGFARGASTGPTSASDMSLLHALGPVQTWPGQELEKCGIDAMIYTRYVLSLLLHDSYDYDLQEQSRLASNLQQSCLRQAVVQCLRSASDESSGFETLVEELCCRLKDLQTPPVSTDTSSPKDCNSESEVIKERSTEEPTTVHEKAQSRSRLEKENKLSNCTVEEKLALYKKQIRHKLEGKTHLRSWSSDSSEGGLSSSGNQGEIKASMKEKSERRVRVGGNSSSSSGRSIRQLCKQGRRPVKEAGRRDPGSTGGKELYTESRNDKEYKEEQLWYTELIAEYFVPLRSTGGKELYTESRNDKEYKEEQLWYTELIAEYFVPLSRKSKLETAH